MKCIKCSKDAKKQDRERNNNRCPSCQHRFVTKPPEDALTDMQIKAAEDIVSANNTLYFSKDQLSYQLQRRLRKRIKQCKFAMFIVLTILIIFSLVAFIRGGIFFVFMVFSTFALIGPLAARFKFNKTINKLDTIISQWVTINPHEKLLTTAKYQANRNTSSNLDGVSFERVLVCDRNETVDFFLSNLFHFHYSCPVLGGNGYPQSICDDMLVRLKQNPNLKVFLVHDYSPAGLAFVRRMKTDSKWFASIPPSNIIDLGLNVGQKKLFHAMTNKRVDRNQKTQETAELALFKPAAIIALCGAAINEGKPFDLITAAAAAAADGGSTVGYG